MLVRHFAQQFARRMKKTIEVIPAETMEALTRYDWPGNIRELQNLIERAVILSPGTTLNVPVEALTPRSPVPASRGAAETLEEDDRRHIIGALDASGWVIAGPAGAAARLGMKRSTLQFRMRKLGIERPARQTLVDPAPAHLPAGSTASPSPPAVPSAGTCQRAGSRIVGTCGQRPPANTATRHAARYRHPESALPARSSLYERGQCSGSPNSARRVDWC